MTDKQKRMITEWRGNGIGYAAIARRLSVSINTVKAHCRRNGLYGNIDPSGTQHENVSVTSNSDGLHNTGDRGNSTVRLSGNGAQPSVTVNVTYAEKPNGAVVADVLRMLISANREVSK